MQFEKGCPVDQFFEFVAGRWAEFNMWSAEPLTNGTLLSVAIVGFFYVLVTLHQLHGALKAIYRLLYKQVNGEYPSFNPLA